ncbi:MAG: 16S rRNA (uracil(1498)-N(3))-methyltransferase [Anaeroplasmataceae bacterium]|nr:16S rRNA (uracil(1498)-N(3))-methyltransferase [Anaeroplasmataceae bacterium]MDE6415139.1 16S rRNA (uracil(1498)-N(3))-methyltransferase [Anaeroplasmataceae bacterium]
MQKFFISLNDFESKVLSSDIAYQIKNVLRGRVKDQFYVGLDGKTFLAEITEIGNKDVKFRVVEEVAGNFELPVFVSLFQGYPKGDKLESIIKYGTQLGISEIHPTLMTRSIVKIDEGKKVGKLERLNKIAKEAAEQSFRNVVPVIKDINKLKDLDFSSYTIKLLCYEESAKEGEKSAFKRAIQSLTSKDRIAVLVGPEGGITPEEVNYLENQGFIRVGLGPRILRTETVIYYILSAISYEWELK